MSGLQKIAASAIGIAIVGGFTYGLWVVFGAILCAQGVVSECVR